MFHVKNVNHPRLDGTKIDLFFIIIIRIVDIIRTKIGVLNSFGLTSKGNA